MRTKWLQHLKNARFHGAKELAEGAEELLREIGPSQERGTVAEYPNERTVRYYLSEGLLPEPHGKVGSASLFGYEHLVTLVAIKKLQSQGLPINVIKAVIEGRTTEQLESLLEDEIKVFTDRPSLDKHRRETGHTDDSDVHVVHNAAASIQALDDVAFSSIELPSQPPPPPPANAAKSFLESLLFSRNTPEPKEEIQLSRPPDEDYVSFSRRPSLSQPLETESRTWSRYEIEPGLELHVRDDYEPVSGLRKVIKSVERILRRAIGK